MAIFNRHLLEYANRLSKAHNIPEQYISKLLENTYFDPRKLILPINYKTPNIEGLPISASDFLSNVIYGLERAPHAMKNPYILAKPPFERIPRDLLEKFYWETYGSIDPRWLPIHYWGKRDKQLKDAVKSIQAFLKVNPSEKELMDFVNMHKNYIAKSPFIDTLTFISKEPYFINQNPQLIKLQDFNVLDKYSTELANKIYQLL